MGLITHTENPVQPAHTVASNPLFIFNVHEFELYGRGIIIEPTSGCDCYFGNSCSREKSCMKDITVRDVLSNIAVLNKNLNK